MADITERFPAEGGGLHVQSDALDAAGSQVAMSVRECAGQIVVALSGELDATNAGSIGALLAPVAVRVPWLIVDLTGLEFTDCAGMRALAAAARQARQAGGGLVLAAPAPLVLRVLDLTGLLTGVPVCSSVEEAAGIASPRQAARTLPGQGAQAQVAAGSAVGPERRQEEGQCDPHQRPTAADAWPRSP